MKRYRVLNIDFDTRATILSLEIQEGWAPNVKAMHEQNKASVRAGLVVQYGRYDSERKIERFVELGAAPFSVLAFHNSFFRQTRDAYVVGSYYPALTGACALGERILNHLLLALRDDFQGTPEYKRVYRKDSFDDWDTVIDTLVAWKVLIPGAEKAFRALKQARHRAIHFNPETDRDARPLALEALRLIHDVIDQQFTAFGARPWYFDHAGMMFVRRAAENEPFVRRVILPSCVNVGPAHRLEGDGMPFRVVDAEYPEAAEVTDEEFVRLFDEAQAKHREASGE